MTLMAKDQMIFYVLIHKTLELKEDVLRTSLF